MNIAHLLQRSARLYPDRPALLVGERVVCDYRELAARVARMAGRLRGEMGLAPGDRVALYMGNCEQYLESLYAVFWAGLVAVPINAKLHPCEAQVILEDSGARLAIVSEDYLPDLNKALGPAGPTLVVAGEDPYAALAEGPAIPVAERVGADLAWLFYTSGTTGRPKGVMLSHRNLQTMTACFFMNVDEVDPWDVVVYAAPMSHGAGLYGFPYMLRGCRHVIPPSGGFEPEELVGLAHSLGHLALFAAPTMVRRLVDALARRDEGGEGFKTIIYGGGPMYAEDIADALRTMGPRFVQIYGQGESPMTITALSRTILADRGDPRWAARSASVGVAQSLVEVAVVDNQGKALPPGEIGEVVVRGDTVMSGYWNNPEASAAALRDGWLWTGDIGSLDEDGFLTLKDRSRDVIISGGSNIYPREVEEVLIAHPGVREVSVVGQRDPEWGEVVVAFVVAGGVRAEELDELCLSRIARFKRPKTYHFVDVLPKNNYGKVLKTALRRLLTETVQ